ncbi:SIMPL domain-containing protein [Flagellimonas abyssi]|uniref:SIMPL domain-containing protein n=1 Tax=Flagellimonas abyssi TaxID=2864871 RepID=A0ABS7EQ65_9FLAO|nr:SIMPL domain-containing protein [Allomuricauda abyssi]MBW8199038.1 SIMPL domain-containing protein [Allomuricauda abyssi]
MKQLLYVLLVAMMPSLMAAQEQSATITVLARAIHVDSSPIYKATVSISPAYSSYASDGMDFEELRSLYQKALELQGISWKEIKERPYEFGFETMGYDKEGAIYEFSTSSIEKMRTFLTIKSLGLQRLNSVAVIKIDENAAKLLYGKAMEDARKKASLIALTLGKELGDVITVEDNQYLNEQVETAIYYDRPVNEYIYSLQVVFETK